MSGGVLASSSWADEHGWQLVWGAWGLALVAFIALILCAVAIMQRLHPLQRALARLAARQQQATELAGQLAEAQQVLAARGARAK